MKKIFAYIKALLKSIVKSKSFLYIFGLFSIVLGFAMVYISYGFYTDTKSGLIINGTASIISPDLEFNLYQQDVDGSGNASNTYTQIMSAPAENFIYKPLKTECTNGIDIESYYQGTFTVNASSIGSCNIYFDYETNPGNTFNILVQDPNDTSVYTPVENIPDRIYTVNASRTTPACNTSTYSNGKVNVVLTENVSCDIYLDFAGYYYYAFGVPTTSSTNDYTTLGKNVFIRDDTPDETTREVCIVRNGELHCFQNNNWEVEQQHIQDVFSDITCDVDSSDGRCDASDFRCRVYSYGSVGCYDGSTDESCSVNASGEVSCG